MFSSGALVPPEFISKELINLWGYKIGIRILTFYRITILSMPFVECFIFPPLIFIYHLLQFYVVIFMQ